MQKEFGQQVNLRKQETKNEHKQDKVTETTQAVTKEINIEKNSSVVNEKDQASEPVSETTEEKN